MGHTQLLPKKVIVCVLYLCFYAARYCSLWHAPLPPNRVPLPRKTGKIPRPSTKQGLPTRLPYIAASLGALPFLWKHLKACTANAACPAVKLLKNGYCTAATTLLPMAQPSSAPPAPQAQLDIYASFGYPRIMNNIHLAPTPIANACFALQSRVALPCQMVDVVLAGVYAAPAILCGFT